jgi:Fe-S oxidoreductase
VEEKPPNRINPAFRERILNHLEGVDLTHCLTCGTCSAGCAVREVDKNYNPRKLVRMVLLGMEEYFRQNPGVPYSCNICGLCEETCPYGINVGKLSIALREYLVEEGLGPLANHKSILADLDFGISPDYTISLPDPDHPECERVFFPGCNLSSYNPELVLAAWSYLRSQFPGTGLILRCCGAPAHDLGMHQRYGEIADSLQVEMERLGARELITSCPDCYHTIKDRQYPFRLTSIYEVVDGAGLPAGFAEARRDTPVLLHDSCKARWEEDMQAGVRSLLAGIGFSVEEFSYAGKLTRCCGQGGMIYGLSPFRVMSLTRLRLEETKTGMMTYCAACRETFTLHRPTLTLLDVLFNPQWEEAAKKPPQKPIQRRENQMRLKGMLSDMCK